MQVTVLPPIDPSRLPRTTLPRADTPPASPAPVGTLFYLADPSPPLAQAAQRRLGLAQPPRELLLAAPGALRHSPEVEEAARKAAIGLLKVVTQQIAKQPGLPPAVRAGVPICWSVYNAWQLAQRWRAGADVPTLVLGVADLMLDGWGKATDAGILNASVALTPGRAESFGFVLLTADALKDGKDVTMALLDDRLASGSALYRAARCLEPVVAAALSEQPELEGVTLLPLPAALGAVKRSGGAA